MTAIISVITAVTKTTVSADHGLTNADFGVAFGHALTALPLHQRFTAKEICDMICPKYANQKCVAYLRKAVAHGIMGREEVPAGVWVDPNGVEHVRMQALYFRK